MEVNAARFAAFRKDHDRAFRRRFPMLGDLSMTYSWGGRLCLSSNSATAFGELEPAVWANSPVVQNLLSYDLPQKLPHPLVASLCAKMVLFWREFRASAEV